MGRDKGLVVQATISASGVLKPDSGGGNIGYEQPMAQDMGIRDASKIDYVTVVSEAGAKIGVSVILTGSAQEPGTIVEINRDKRTGILLDAKKQQLRFDQPYMNQIGIDLNSAVEFTRVSSGGRDYAAALIGADPKERRRK